MSGAVKFVCVFLSLQAFGFREGFFAINDRDVPPSVQAQAPAVYHFLPLTEKPVGVLLERNFQRAIDSSQGVQKKIVSQLIEECKKTPKKWWESWLGRTCNVHFSTFGTAFLIEDGQTLITCRHCVDPQVESYLQTLTSHPKLDLAANNLRRYKRLSGYNLKFLLYDQNGELVYDSRKTIAYLSGIGDSRVTTVVGDALLTRHMTDWAKIKLSRPLEAEPIKFKSSHWDNFSSGKPVYVIGYPEPTGTSRTDHFGAPDSNGMLLVGIGKVLSRKDAWEKVLKEKVELHEETEDLFRTRLIYSDSDLQHGNSGGPLLDEEGSAISVVCSAFKFKREELSNSPPLVTIGVTYDWINKTLQDYPLEPRR